MTEKKRIAIFIDGGNFHHLAIKKLMTSELEFDFEQFVLFLAQEESIVDSWKRYYVGTVREKEGDEYSKQSMARQNKFFTNLKKESWVLRTSKLKTRIEKITVDERMQNYEKLKSIGLKEVIYERKREKGIDVMMATDLIVGAVEDVYDMAIVVSSDADLLPAIEWVRKSKNKQVMYVGFSMQNGNDTSKPLYSMIMNTDIQRVLVETDLRCFVKKMLL